MIRQSMPSGFWPEGGSLQKASCREVREIAAQHLVDIRAKISDLRKLERSSAKMVAACAGTTAPECSYSVFSISNAPHGQESAKVGVTMKEDYLGTLKSLLEKARPRLAKSYRLEFKNCFGAVAGYVNGNIFVSCGRFGVALRLPPGVLEDLFDEAGISHLKYFPNGHVKKEYAVIPPRILQNQIRLKKLVGKSVRYAVSR
jgi:hypothetical protein